MPTKAISRLSKTDLLVFMLIFAVIGGIAIFRSFATTSTPPGDLNNDNVINVFDLSILLSNYGQATATGDLNGDSVVNLFDLSILLSNYGKTTSTSPPTDLNTHTTLGFNTLDTNVSDEFSGSAGTKPNSTKWGSKNFSASNGSVVYWNGLSNVQLDGTTQGNLDIFAQKTSGGWNSSWISGNKSYIGTRYVEARAKVPDGAGTWSGPIWEWEAPYGATALENDVIEQLGTEPSSYHTTLHANTTLSVGKSNNTSVTLSNGYHIYGAAVYADRVDYYFDGTKIQTITKTELGNNWGFVEKSMVLNIDLDMGGWGGTPSPSLPSTVRMLVDYIRVYTP